MRSKSKERSSMKTGTHTKTPEEYLREPYARILIPEEDGRFSAEILEFPGCFSQGDTAEEAIRNLEEAARNWVEATLKLCRPIPEPSSNYGFGGKVALRLPRSLHKRAVQLAQRDGVSLNTFLVGAIAARVGAEDLYLRMAKRLEDQIFNRAVAADNRLKMIISTIENWQGVSYKPYKVKEEANTTSRPRIIFRSDLLEVTQ